MDGRYHLRPTEGDSGNFFTSLLTIGQIYSLIVRDYKIDIEWLLSSHKVNMFTVELSIILSSASSFDYYFFQENSFHTSSSTNINTV